MCWGRQKYWDAAFVLPYHISWTAIVSRIYKITSVWQGIIEKFKKKLATLQSILIFGQGITFDSSVLDNISYYFSQFQESYFLV